jgi:hypothetical protein
VPVDIYVPGCPPTAEALRMFLLLSHQRIVLTYSLRSKSSIWKSFLTLLFPACRSSEYFLRKFLTCRCSNYSDVSVVAALPCVGTGRRRFRRLVQMQDARGRRGSGGALSTAPEGFLDMYYATMATCIRYVTQILSECAKMCQWMHWRV